MRKTFTLMLMLAMCTSAWAGIDFDGRMLGRKVFTPAKSQPAPSPGGYRSQAPMAMSDVITAQPEGELVTYTRSGFGFTLDENRVLYSGEQWGNNVAVVYDADGTTVYLNHILYSFHEWWGDYWVRGTLSADGTTITVPLDQPIAWSTDYEAYIRLTWGHTVITENADGTQGIAFEREADVAEAVYTIADGTLTLQGTNGPSQMQNNINDFVAQGLTAYWEDDGAWPGFMEWNTVLTEKPVVPAPDIITEQPEGELHNYVRTGGNIYQGWSRPYATAQQGMTAVVFDPDGTTVYLRDPVYDVTNDVWVRGTLSADGTKITVPLDQYIYWDESSENGMQLKWVTTSTETVVDASGQEQLVLRVGVHTDVAEATYTIAGGTITLDGTQGNLEADDPDNLTATGLGVVYSASHEFAAMDFGTIYNEFVLQPAIPANPVLLDDAWFDNGTEDGYNCLDFQLPSEDIYGNYIDPKCLSYSIYTDGDQLFVFDAETYSFDFEQDATEVPYEIYSQGYDVNDSRVYFYRTNEGENPFFMERIGIQAHYTVPVVDESGATNMVRNSSDIVYWYRTDLSAIADVKAEAASSRNTDDAYYSILGQKCSSAANLPAGIYIHKGQKVIVK